ncbi:M23 family metallopeptidase [Vineibacter terrae]|uniref:M23 family metallopeptidase n=2 Tax=Vineibacter terrae TaxID=2586908 RepID=A0A5C8PCI7_9HYPH|nr:M23 family metallopeptidase [Vineibacter terrae]
MNNNAHRTPSRARRQPMPVRAGIVLALSLITASCGWYDSAVYGGRQGTIEYPGSASASASAPIYVVQEGDTIDSIASRFGVPASTIADRNSLKPSDKLAAGKWLEIPNARVVEQGMAPPPSGTPSSGPSTPAPTSTDGRVSSTDLPPPTGTPQSQPPKPVAGTLPPSSPSPAAGSGTAPQPVPIPTASSTPTRPAATAPRFDWPLRGSTLQGFGNRPDGQRNDGINIAAAQGATVKAAEGGTVVYVGSEVKGLGNLVLLSHAGGYVTAYAHLDRASVAKGAAVKKGQAIGTVGQTGGVSQPQLHFEIRQRNKPVDPTTLLP